MTVDNAAHVWPLSPLEGYKIGYEAKKITHTLYEDWSSLRTHIWNEQVIYH